MADMADFDVPSAEKHLPKSTLQGTLGLVAVLACFVLLAWVSWAKQGHLIFDTGQETEISARLLAGQRLYGDLQTYYGPLSYYANALALLIGGHHIEVFYTVGLVLALATTLLVYKLAKSLTNAPWAALCTVYVLIYGAFTTERFFNFIVPYSYGAVYATVLCLLAFTAIDRYGQTGRIGWLFAAAIACGFAGCAKQEYGVASLLSVLVGANLCSPKNLRARVGRTILIILVASASVLLPFALLAQQVSWEKIYTNLVPISKTRILADSGLFYFSPVRTINIWKYTFYNFFATTLVVWAAIVAGRWLSKRQWLNCPPWIRNLVEVLTTIAFAFLGLLLLRINVRHTFTIVVAASVLAWVWAVASRRLSRRQWLPDSKWLRIVVKLVAIIAAVGLSCLILRGFACCSNTVFHPLGNLAWLLPLLVGWFVLNWRQLIQHRHAPLLWTLLVFSVLLNARFWFNLDFYGIYAVTAILLFFTFLYQLALRTGLPLARFVLICLLIGGSMNLVNLGEYRYAVHSTHGTMYTDDADLALAFNQTIGHIQKSGATSVLTVPAGATLNFLTATHSPSQETIFLPGILPTPEAEREFLARMHNKPPALIVYVNVPFFWLNKGYQTYAEFNPLIDRWISHEHQLVYTSPKLVFGNKEWTIRIYK